MIEKVEKSVADALAASDVSAMTTHILRGYGAEIYGFLVAAHGGYGNADEVFSMFSESLWRSLERYEARCSARTWAYRIARAASVDYSRGENRRPSPQRLSTAEVQEVANRVRTETAAYLRTEHRTEFQKLRVELDPESRSLLVLRVDRNLPWKDLALIFLQQEGEEPTDAAIAREATRLRQRFQTIKKRLRDLGRERGLLE